MHATKTPTLSPARKLKEKSRHNYRCGLLTWRWIVPNWFLLPRIPAHRSYTINASRKSSIKWLAPRITGAPPLGSSHNVTTVLTIFDHLKFMTFPRPRLWWVARPKGLVERLESVFGSHDRRLLECLRDLVVKKTKATQRNYEATRVLECNC